ncbi:VWA domain-containing protein [Shewanella sp. KX20019]|uniref:vWA domain-containing protein n=1 Tax=Shewanella sp. KX20019 TaxID=2803864 RepID=UPI001925E0EE|nr:VWA domain-containing protein [Shewanella sp. KX20019]QQX78367.1 VWA domain-containing protein [Shewanella sp. KX20019]
MDFYNLASQFHFLRPYWLLLLLPFAVFLLLYVRRKPSLKTQKSALPVHLEKALKIGDAGWRKGLPVTFWALGFTLAMIIAAGPTWQRQASPFGEDNAPLIILLDVSESMLQTDLQPSRLQRAKQKIADLLALREGGSTALVVYSGSAHIAMPLTKDNAVLLPLLDAISPKVMPRKGKFAEYGLAEIDKLLLDNDLPIGAASVLWITDGLGSDSAKAIIDYFKLPRKMAADSLQAEGERLLPPLQLIILGSGDEDKTAEIPFQHDELKLLATAAGGHYQQTSVDNSDVSSINREIARNVIINSDSAEPWKEMSYPLVFVLAAIFLLWFRKGWTVQWCFVGILMLATPQPSFASGIAVQAAFSSNTVAVVAADTELNGVGRVQQRLVNAWYNAWLTPEQQGQMYFANGQYSKAAAQFTDPLWKATAFYMAEDFKRAQIYFMRSDTAESLFGAATALAHQREYIAARNLYQQVVHRYPSFVPAQTNLQKIQKIIDDINRQSESQANTENEASKELGDEPQTSDGAEEKVSAEMLVQQTYTAEQLLADDALTQAWMKRVEGDPRRFLATKFSLQLNQRKQTISSPSTSND